MTYSSNTDWQQQLQQQAAAAVGSPSASRTPLNSGSASPAAGSSSAQAAAGTSASADGSGGGAAVQMLSSQLLSELNSARSVLVQLMLSAYAFLNSPSMEGFFEKLGPVVQLYDDMHELPVVQKRIKCNEMSCIRTQLVKDAAFMQVLQAICALRHHLYSLSRKVLLMNLPSSSDVTPIDLLLGSMSSELYHQVKGLLPPDVSDFFGNSLPHPKLAVLVFVEFTGVDPLPTTN